MTFKKGDLIIYTNNAGSIGNKNGSAKYETSFLGEVLSVGEHRVKVRLTNQAGKQTIKDVSPEYLKFREDDYARNEITGQG